VFFISAIYNVISLQFFIQRHVISYL